MEPTTTICPHCHNPVLCDTTFPGLVVSCPHCPGSFRMPETSLDFSEEAPKSPRPPRRARRDQSPSVLIPLAISVASIAVGSLGLLVLFKTDWLKTPDGQIGIVCFFAMSATILGGPPLSFVLWAQRKARIEAARQSRAVIERLFGCPACHAPGAGERVGTTETDTGEVERVDVRRLDRTTLPTGEVVITERMECVGYRKKVRYLWHYRCRGCGHEWALDPGTDLLGR